MMAEYKSAERNGVHLITFPELVDGDDPSCETLFKTWLLATPNIHVFDFKDTVKVKPSAYRFFLTFNQQLKANKKQLYCMNVRSNISDQFRQDGLSSAFATIASLEEAQKKAKPPAKAQVDVEIINPFIEGTMVVLETQAKVKLTPGRPFLRKPDMQIPMEIAGVIAITCREFTGSIVLCFQAKTFLNIYEGLVGERHETITQETEDAAAELLNMIFGHAKSVLNGTKGYTLEKSIPTVLVGEKLRVHHQTKSQAIVLPFDGPAGAFHIEISVDQN